MEILPSSAPQQESDAQCWERMLALQREYHCYNSARLEAAVEALENGVRFEEVPIRKFFFSSFCLVEEIETEVVWFEAEYGLI